MLRVVILQHCLVENDVNSAGCQSGFRSIPVTNRVYHATVSLRISRRLTGKVAKVAGIRSKWPGDIL